jgi:proteasome accessory factor A
LKKAIELDKELNPNDPIRIFKNNVDNKGASYGTHENYLMKRATDFNKIIYFLTPFLVTRQIFTGAGRIGIGQIPQNDSFQISQRADYFETLVGLETTLRRPIINTRDEPHADSSKYRRLHLIIGDANRCDFANILKIGTTDLVLTMIEEDYLNNLDCDLVDPLQSLKDVSQNINLDKNLRLSSGNQLNSIEIQYSYLTKAIEFNKNISKSNYFAKIIEMWKSTLSALDKDTSQLIGKIDWLTKKYLIDKIKQESKSNAIDVLKSMDIQYSELTNQENIFNILIKNNIVESFYDENEIEYCELNPPHSSRAYFRANMLKKYPSYISAASWDNVILDLDPNKSLLRIPTTDPYGFNYESHSQIFNNASSIQDLVSVLSSHDAHR